MNFIRKQIVFFAAAFFILSLSVAAQTKTSVWTIDFVKTKNGQRENYLKFVENNWAKARGFMKEKGIVSSFQFLSLPASEPNAQWDVLLVTEYVDQTGYEKCEAIFDEYRKSAPADPNKIDRREIAEIKMTRNFNSPVTKEIGEIMLAAQIANPEEAAARVPLENYLKGHATGNPEFMKRAFHTEGKLIFVRDGKYSTRTFEEYIAGMNGKPAADEKERKRRIETIDVAGNAGVGKIILDYPTVRFVDYMTLLKIDGEWKIVNKSFYAKPKPQK